jgi:catechol-2,3-dioxygenase
VSETQEWPGGIAAITLFVEDLDSAKTFYQEVFGLPVHYEDDSSAVFRFGDTLVNLLKANEAPGLIDLRRWRAAMRACGSSSRSASMTSTRSPRS